MHLQYVELKSFERKWFTANKKENLNLKPNLIACEARAKRTEA